LFERYFGGVVQYRRDRAAQPDGEMIVFVEAAMRELGHPYSRGAIGKAVTAFKDQRAGYRADLNNRGGQLGRIKQK
jgi:hypothetical protein